MSVLVVVQARTGSSRFPGKVLAEIEGEPMLGFMLDRIRSLEADPGTRLVVATSDLTADDPVAEIARGRDLAAVRGSEGDVLARFALALEEHPADLVVRLTADCPLMDPGVVRASVSHHLDQGADYTSNTLARTFPDGLDVEVMTADALRWAASAAQAGDEREHVTPYLQRHPNRIQIAQVVDPAHAGYERWTVDRPEDLDIVRDAIASVADPITANWLDLLYGLGRRAHVEGACATPTATQGHTRGEPYHRAWTVADRSGSCGSALVVVSDGGTASITIEGARPDLVQSAVQERLRADLQVTELSSGWE
jgi:spore coat polysaccharide biosynthesis protein SpsF